MEIAAVSAVAPLLFVAYITSPFVSFVHIRLPPFARQSEAMLRACFRRLPADTELRLVTMSPIAKPRFSKVALSELRPANERLGVVNYTRDTAAENAARKWYNFRAVGKFSIGQASSSRQPWLWDMMSEAIRKRAA
jgi:hypothetical protein